jgi:hypothetical protein
MPPFKTRLRVLRAERDWTQAELAAHVGVSRQSINSIAKDRFQPNPSTPLQRTDFSPTRNWTSSPYATPPGRRASLQPDA